jgi:phosphonate transport system substrate-binding protein
MFTRFNLLILAITLSLSTSLYSAEKGSIDNPIIMAMVPGLDNVILEENGKIIQKFLEKETGLTFKLLIPNNFIAVVEAMGTKRVDIALMNTYGYILASKKFNARALLIGTFHGASEYYGQIITKTDGPNSLKELNGKTFAFVDPASTSGHILAKKALEDEHVQLKSSLFAGKHDVVVNMVYQGRVDAGATYHTLPLNGVPQDARVLVKTQYPDVLEKIKIIKITGPIPSDPIVFGAHIDSKLSDKIVASLKKLMETNEGKEAFMKTYHLDGVKDATDKNWDNFRKLLVDIHQDPEALMQKK